MSTNFVQIIKNSVLHHNVKTRTLFIKLNAHNAELKYRRTQGVFNLIHTSIPEAYQGHGLGTLFAERVLDHFLMQGQKVRLTCKFLQVFYMNNIDKYAAIVVE